MTATPDDLLPQEGLVERLREEAAQLDKLATVISRGHYRRSDAAALCRKAADRLLSNSIEIEGLRKRVEEMVALHDSFMSCNDGFMGNQADAYYHIAKQFDVWDRARSALQDKGPQRSEGDGG